MGNTISSNSSAAAAQQRQAEQARQIELQRQAEQARQAQQAAQQAAQQSSKPQEQKSDTQVGAKSSVAENYQRDSYDTQHPAGAADGAAKSGSDGGYDRQGLVDSTQQTTLKGCGPANIAQLVAAANNRVSPEQADKDTRQSVDKANGSSAIVERNQGRKIDLANGTTPGEMAVLLGEQGQRVVRGFDNYDAGYLKDAINKGQNGLALVDSNALGPDGKNAPPGPLHWVTIDNIDKNNTPDNPDDDRFEVVDPATNSKYSVTEEQLKTATEKARAQSGTGGVLVVEPDATVTTDAQRQQLALDNLNNSALLGDDDGGQGRKFGNLSGSAEG